MKVDENISGATCIPNAIFTSYAHSIDFDVQKKRTMFALIRAMPESKPSFFWEKVFPKLKKMEFQCTDIDVENKNHERKNLPLKLNHVNIAQNQ